MRGPERSLRPVRLYGIGNIVGRDLGTVGILGKNRLKDIFRFGLGLSIRAGLLILHRPHQRGEIVIAAGLLVPFPGKNIARPIVFAEIIRRVFARMPDMAAVGALDLAALGTEGTGAQIERGRALRTCDNHGNANLLFICTIL